MALQRKPPVKKDRVEVSASDIEWIKNFYIQNIDKIKNNKNKLINHYFGIMNDINKLL
jgi:hypothetical protein